MFMPNFVLDSYWRPSFIPQALASFFPSLYVVEHLYIYGPRQLPAHFGELIEGVQWLEILKLFTVAKKLYLPKEIAQYIAPALQELVGKELQVYYPPWRVFLWEISSYLDLSRTPLGGSLLHDSSQATL
jgi:hypothetical protein